MRKGERVVFMSQHAIEDLRQLCSSSACLDLVSSKRQPSDVDVAINMALPNGAFQGSCRLKLRLAFGSISP